MLTLYRQYSSEEKRKQRKNYLFTQSASLKIHWTRKKRRRCYGDAALSAPFGPCGVSACSLCVFNPIWARESRYVAAYPLLLPITTGLPVASRKHLSEAPPGAVARGLRPLWPKLRSLNPSAILSLAGLRDPPGLLPLNRGPGGFLMRARMSRERTRTPHRAAPGKAA